MIVNELFDPAPEGYYDEKSDKTTANKDDSRGNRITLAHLNQLRKSHDVRKIEHEKKLKKIAKQYFQPEAGGMGGGMGGGLGGLGGAPLGGL